MECKYKDTCELYEDYISLKQTYEACYNEHMKVIKQNSELQNLARELRAILSIKENLIKSLEKLP